jgi:hypothetical protein
VARNVLVCCMYIIKVSWVRKYICLLRRVVPNNVRKLKKGDKLRGIIVTRGLPYKASNIGYEAKSALESRCAFKKNRSLFAFWVRAF